MWSLSVSDHLTVAARVSFHAVPGAGVYRTCDPTHTRACGLRLHRLGLVVGAGARGL